MIEDLRKIFIQYTRQTFHKLLGVVVLLVCVVVFASCSNENTEISSNTAPTTISLRFGHDMPEDSAQHCAAIYFAELVKTRSENLVEIDIFPNQSLDTDFEMINMAQITEKNFMKYSHI